MYKRQVVILIANAGQIPNVIVDVVKCAFGSKEALLGGGVGIAIQQGGKPVSYTHLNVSYGGGIQTVDGALAAGGAGGDDRGI